MSKTSPEVRKLFPLTVRTAPAEDVAETVLAVAKLPPRVCVPEMQVVPTYL
jgi:NADP-dependent 3-hydroxy acid dehydrogenase YdfG